MRYEYKLDRDMMCPLEYGLNIFGGKWKSRIICVLSGKESMRYNELKKELNNITDTVLGAMLKELLADDFINRIQYNEIPLRVEYLLTEKGKSVLPILQSICVWSRKNSPEDLSQKLPVCRSCPHL